MNINATEVPFFVSNWSSSGSSHIGSLPINAQQKKLAGGIHSSGMRASLVHDVTECQTQNGSSHGRVHCDFQLSIFNNLDHKLTETLSSSIFSHSF